MTMEKKKKFLLCALIYCDILTTKENNTMKSKLVLILLILASALLHVGPAALVALLAGAFIPLTDTNVALVFLALGINAIALVQLHVWNGSFNKKA